MSTFKRLTLLVCAVAVFVVPVSAANAAITTKTIDYGPYTIPAGNGDPHDHEEAGMITNQIVQNIAKPCTGCSIIGVTPDLVYTDGTKATISQGPMLHHAMFAAKSSGKSDVTCAGKGPGLLGERFFASGDERTPLDLTSLPYGYKVNSSETWNMVFDLMNWETTSKTVKIRMTWKYATGSDSHQPRTAAPGLARREPVLAELLHLGSDRAQRHALRLESQLRRQTDRRSGPHPRPRRQHRTDQREHRRHRALQLGGGLRRPGLRNPRRP